MSAYDELLKTIESIPKPPLANETVIIQARRNEKGKLIPFNEECAEMCDMCEKTNVEYVLSEHIKGAMRVPSIRTLVWQPIYEPRKFITE